MFLLSITAFAAALLTIWRRMGSERRVPTAAETNARILAAIEYDKSGNRAGYITFKTPDEMYQHFGLRLEDSAE